MATTYNSTHTGQEIDNLKTDIINTIYPIGSIYISTNSTSPAILFGGSWVAISGKFLLAADNTHVANSIGGEETVSLNVSNLPAHAHHLSSDTLAHSFAWGSGKTNTVHIQNAIAAAGTVDGNRLYTYQNSWNITVDTGGNEPHNNMPPYLAVYMWQRTA